MGLESLGHASAHPYGVEPRRGLGGWGEKIKFHFGGLLITVQITAMLTFYNHMRILRRYADY